MKKQDNSTNMCYFFCDRCNGCIYNSVERVDGVYNAFCGKNRYESSYIKRLISVLSSRGK